MIRAILCPDPVDVSDMHSGINFLDLKAVWDNLIVFLSILTTKYVKSLNNGLAGLVDLWIILSPVLYPWLGSVIWSLFISTADAPKLIGLMNVLRVVSSNWISKEVVMPGVKDIETRSLAIRLWASLQTTVPTTFSAKPVISVFVGVKLWDSPLPNPSKNNWYAVEPIPVTEPVEPIPNGFVDIPSKSLPRLIANTGAVSYTHLRAHET